MKDGGRKGQVSREGGRWNRKGIKREEGTLLQGFVRLCVHHLQYEIRKFHTASNKRPRPRDEAGKGVSGDESGGVGSALKGAVSFAFTHK